MIISDKKYACETCIKGHRSSSCKHFDRPLFEIKKKGRPITQCEHCRELRKTKQVHVKCICEAPKSSPTSSSEGGMTSALTKKGIKPGFESAAFPNGLPLQASGTLVASPPLTPDDVAGCKCASSGGPCGCCVPKKSQTHRRSRTTSSHPGTSSDARIGMAPAELRPVLPGPKPSELFLGGGGHHHDPSRGLYHNYARHDTYSPYGRAYDVHAAGHQQGTSLAMTTTPPAGYGDADSNMMQQQTLAMPGCSCGSGCRCRGCGAGINGGGGTCSNPETCVSCVSCSITALQPFLSQPGDPTATATASNIDEWLRSLPQGGAATSSSSSTAFLDDDLISASTNFNWDPNIPLIQDPGANSYPNFTVEGDSDFTTASIFRLSGVGSGQGYPYLDPNFLDGVRFDTSTELRPRSHSPASAMHLARGGGTVDMFGSSPSSSEAILRRHMQASSDSSTGHDGFNFALNVTGMRSAPQLNQLLVPNSNPFHTSSSVSPVQYAPSNSDSDTSLRDNFRY